MHASNANRNASTRKPLLAGRLLSIASAALLLSACAGQTVVRQPCEPYPAVPAALNQPPANADLVPAEMRPRRYQSSSASPVSTAPSRTLPE